MSDKKITHARELMNEGLSYTDLSYMMDSLYKDIADGYDYNNDELIIYTVLDVEDIRIKKPVTIHKLIETLSSYDYARGVRDGEYKLKKSLKRLLDINQ